MIKPGHKPGRLLADEKALREARKKAENLEENVRTAREFKQNTLANELQKKAQAARAEYEALKKKYNFKQ